MVIHGTNDGSGDGEVNVTDPDCMNDEIEVAATEDALDEGAADPPRLLAGWKLRWPFASLLFSRRCLGLDWISAAEIVVFGAWVAWVIVIVWGDDSMLNWIVKVM